ncbi:MAG: DUF4150 domain-containing protein [Myxococcales bacterium]|nr:DUF4150 domain-containing protein [Myxococcales bacterium]
MALTVFAEKMGFWHRGSGGFGIAPLDVCLSPPPGPVPIPYTNYLEAKDLIKGSKTVRIDGEPTALEDLSETSTSYGDEGGTLGGSVVTGVILGKGYFMVWSMTVYIEGKGVARHGDMMGQNSASAPPSSVDAAAVNAAAAPRATVPAPVAAQRAAQARTLQATGPGNSQPKQAVPCDFERIIFKCGHGKGERKGKQFEFWYGGTIQSNLKKGTKSTPITSNIQLTAGDTTGTADTLSIEIKGGPGYGCGKSHPLVVITDRATGKKETFTGQTKLEYKAKSKHVSMPAIAMMSPAAVLAYFWFSPKTTNSYIVEIVSCGVLANLNPGFRKLSQTVEVLASDTYKFGVEFPAAISKKQDGGKPLRPRGHMKSQDDWVDEAGIKAKAAALAKETGKSFTFERNGEDYSADLKIGEIIAAIIRLREGVAAVMDAIDGLQAGVKPVCKVELFSGSLSIEWGPKEWSDQRVFKWWKVEAALTIIKATIGISAGVKFFEGHWWAVVGVLKGTITGEVPLTFSKEAAPDGKPAEVVLSGKVTGAITATGQLGDKWLFVEGVMKASITVEGGFKIGANAPGTLDYKVSWSGLKLTGKVESKIFGSVPIKEWTLIEGKTLGEGSLFEPKPAAARQQPATPRGRPTRAPSTPQAPTANLGRIRKP